MVTRVYGAGFEQYTPQKQQRIALGRTVAEEGMVLLENNGALPLAPGSKVALLGVGQLGFLHGGSGSGGTFADYVVKLPEAMTNAGAQVDAELLSCYTEYCAAQQKEIEKVPPFMRRGTIPEMPISRDVLHAAAARTDAAVFTISRLADEGRDRKLAPGDYFLSPEEHALLAEARTAFDIPSATDSAIPPSPGRRKVSGSLRRALPLPSPLPTPAAWQARTWCRFISTVQRAR